MKRLQQFLLAAVFFLSAFIGKEKLIAKEYNVNEFGASGAGTKVVTNQIQDAIDQAGKTGGVVVFPSGTYLTGTLYLKSNVTLELQKGATLLGSTDLSDYPENLPACMFFRKGVIKRALIYAENLVNISILGEGTIDGQGYAFKEPTDKNVSSYSVRPYVIWMIKCKKVRVEGIKLQNSALWMQHYLACENVSIRNIEVYNHSNKNNDMMDIDGCKDVIISDCRGDTDDDGITLKSTHAQPNENITIINCILSSHCNAIKCGTESNAGFKNITISNCVIRPSSDREVIYGKPDGISGISLEVVDGAEMNGVNISNVVMDGPAVPLFIRLGNRARGYDSNLPKPEVGSIQNISISNITAFNALKYGCSITGIPGHTVKNVRVDNVSIFYAGGGTMEDAGKVVDEKEGKYPEATMFGDLPAYGMYLRHAENIDLSDVEFHFQEVDYRPSIVLDDVNWVKIDDIRVDIDENASLIKAYNARNLYLHNLHPNSNATAALQLHGKVTENIRLSALDSRQFMKIFETLDGADAQEVTVSDLFE